MCPRGVSVGSPWGLCVSPWGLCGVSVCPRGLCVCPRGVPVGSLWGLCGVRVCPRGVPVGSVWGLCGVYVESPWGPRGVPAWCPRGADVGGRGCPQAHGHTALHMAAALRGGQQEALLRLLLRWGADPALPNLEHQRARALLPRGGHGEQVGGGGHPKTHT